MDLRPTFSFYYPQGSLGPGSGIYQGQCGVFARALVDVPPMGDTIQTKKAAVQKYGILRANIKEFLPGDVLIFDLGPAFPNGHIAVCSSTDQTRINLSESNYHLDLRVDHTRYILASSPQIYGVLRGPLNVTIINPTPPMPQPVVIKSTVVINASASPTPWPSIDAKLQAIKDWYASNSGGLINFDFTVKYVNLSGIKFNYLPDGSAVIDEMWFDQNVRDHYAHNTTLIVNYTDLPGYFPGNLILLGRTLGYFGEPVTKTVIASLENDMSQVYPSESAFVDYFKHELMHCCFTYSGQHIGDQFFGGDRTHYWWYPPNYIPGLTSVGNPEGSFSELNYLNIQSTLTKGVSMIVVKFDDGATEYAMADDLTLIPFASPTALTNTLKGRAIEQRTFPASQRPLFTIASSVIN